MQCRCGNTYEYRVQTNEEYNRLDDMCSRCRAASNAASREYEHSDVCNAPFLSHVNNK